MIVWCGPVGLVRLAHASVQNTATALAPRMDGEPTSTAGCSGLQWCHRAGRLYLLLLGKRGGQTGCEEIIYACIYARTHMCAHAQMARAYAHTCIHMHTQHAPLSCTS